MPERGERRTEASATGKGHRMTLPTGPAGHGDSVLNWGHALEVINVSPAPCAFQKVIKSLITYQVAIKWPQCSSSAPEPKASGPTTQGFCFVSGALLCPALMSWVHLVTQYF